MNKTLEKGLDNTQIQDLRGAFKSALPFRKRMIEVLEEIIESERKKSVTEGSYENPNWALKQADLVGAERAFRRVMKLLDEKS